MSTKPATFRSHHLASMAKTMAPRASAHKRGYDRRWQKYRLWFLRQPENAHCVTPGCRRPPTVVDHKQDHKGDLELFWDESNHQPMCKPCHDAKTAREDGAFGRMRGAGNWPG